MKRMFFACRPYTEEELKDASEKYFGVYNMYYIDEDDLNLRKSLLSIYKGKIPNRHTEYTILFDSVSVSHYHKGVVNFHKGLDSLQMIGLKSERIRKGRKESMNTEIIGDVMLQFSQSGSDFHKSYFSFEGIMTYYTAGKHDLRPERGDHLTAKRFCLRKATSNPHATSSEIKKADTSRCFQECRDKISEDEKHMFDYLLNSRLRFGALTIGL